MTTFVDSDVLIFIMEKHKYFCQRALNALGRLQPTLLVNSALIRLECLVLPRRHANIQLESEYEQYFQYGSIRAPIEEPTFEFALRLRAKYRGLKTPDSLNLATAILSGCSAFLTNDGDLQWVTEILVETI